MTTTADAMTFGEDLRHRVVRRLAGFDVAAQGHEGLRRAAVAVALVAGQDDVASVVLCRRGRVGSHQGQWGLPGGRIDDSESAQTAAVRELGEEVGLIEPEVLGRLDDYVSRSGFHITPFVVWCAGQVPTVTSPAEIHSVHRVGLPELVREDSPRWQRIPESDRAVLQLPIDDWFLHAPTAAVLYQLAEVVLRGRHTRVDTVEEPVFAWR